MAHSISAAKLWAKRVFVRQGARLIAPFGLLIAGCGSAFVYTPHAGNEVFSISPSTRAVTTNGQVQFRATLASGEAAAVNWTVSQGQNDSAIGEGSIDATGLYTPPAALSQDAVEVLITARLQGDASSGGGSIASALVSVTPGFVQPLTPETATLAPNASLQIAGEIAEVNGGSVQWKLGRDAAGAGGLSSLTCGRSLRNYTTCTVIYTAPATLPAAGTPISVVGIVTGAGTSASANAATAPVSIRLNGDGITSTPLTNQAAQAGPMQLGASGGNNGDYDADASGNVLECCGGTLGALVASQSGSQYILSNNHVLAESDQAQAGDTILQPGLIDSGCTPDPARGVGRPVGALKYYVPLATPQSNVDAALAAVNPGAVEPDGAILQLGAATQSGAAAGGVGPPATFEATLAAAPPAGGRGEVIDGASFGGNAPLEVVKSGRTTGLTCSTVDAINLDVEVDYFKDCAETQPYYTKTFTGQLGIPGNGFADSGDSGALVVDGRNAEPVGLLYATGTDGAGGGYSLANPIRDVLTELGSQAGQQFSIVGGAQHPVACLNYSENVGEENAAGPLPAVLVAKATTVAQNGGAALVRRGAGVLGVAVGRSADNPRETALVVYLDRAFYPDRAISSIPPVIDGVRTVVIPTDASTFESGGAPPKPAVVAGVHLSASVLDAAAEVQRRYAKQLMADPAIFGVGVTQSHDSPAEAALLVLVDAHRTPLATPTVEGGLRVRYVYLDRFHVTKSKLAGGARPASCSPGSSSTSPDETSRFRSRLPLP
jgi:hypothetical protein